MMRVILGWMVMIPLWANFYQEIDPETIQVGDIRKWTSHLSYEDSRTHIRFVENAFHSNSLSAVCEDTEQNLFLMMDQRCQESRMEEGVIFVCFFGDAVKAYNAFDCLPAY